MDSSPPIDHDPKFVEQSRKKKEPHLQRVHFVSDSGPSAANVR